MIVGNVLYLWALYCIFIISICEGCIVGSVFVMYLWAVFCICVVFLGGQCICGQSSQSMHCHHMAVINRVGSGSSSRGSGRGRGEDFEVYIT